MPHRTLTDPGDLSWVPHADLLGQTPLACVDGRTTRRVVGTPGGSMGELIVVLAAVETLRGQPLPATFVVEALKGTADHLGLYHHSDDHALENLRARSILPPEAEASWLRYPPAAVRSALRHALGEAESTGCGHLAGMLRATEASSPIRPALVRTTLRVFFDLLWDGHPRLDFEVLTGHHRESAVVVVRSCGSARAWGRTAAVIPHQREVDSVFVLHVDAARWFRRQVVHLLLDQLGVYLPGIAAESLLAEAETLAEAALRRTLQQLAPDLPVEEVSPPCSRTPAVG